MFVDKHEEYRMWIHAGDAACTSRRLVDKSCCRSFPSGKIGRQDWSRSPAARILHRCWSTKQFCQRTFTASTRSAFFSLTFVDQRNLRYTGSRSSCKIKTPDFHRGSYPNQNYIIYKTRSAKPYIRNPNLCKTSLLGAWPTFYLESCLAPTQCT